MYPRIEPQQERIISKHIKQVQDDPSLVLYFPFIDPTSSIVQDYSGKRNHGTRYGTTATEINGKTALSFDGVDDYMEIDTKSGIPVYPNGVFSIVMWIKAPPQNNCKIYSEGYSENSNPIYVLSTSNTSPYKKIRLVVRDDDGTILLDKIFINDVFDDKWHLITFRDNNGSVDLYVDSLFDDSASYTRGTLTLNRAGFGALLYGTTEISFLNGIIVFPRIYNRALSPAEIKNIYETERDIFGV